MWSKTSVLRLGIIAVVLSCGLSPSVMAEVNDGDSVTIGCYHQLKSEVLGEERMVAVYLPYNYEQSNDVYPVLYMLGGESKYRLMKMAATMEQLEGTGNIPPLIIIGIDEPNAVRDYFPQPLENRPGSGRADNFIKFLVEELIPWVDGNYRTAGYRVLYGASNAGMFTVYTMLTNPAAFSAYLTASPSVGWFPEFMQQQARAVFDSDEGLSTTLYMNYGSDDYESIVLNALPGFVALFDSAAPGNLRWVNEVIESGGHVPYISEYNGLSFIFHDWSYPEDRLLIDGLAGLRQYYTRLSATYGFDVRIPAELLMDLGMNSYRDSNWTSALEIFQVYGAEHPSSVRAHYMIGNAHLQAGDTTRARESFRKTLEIDPSFRRAKQKLEELGGEG